MKMIPAAILALLLIVTACSPVTPKTPTPDPNLLYSDNFSDPSSGWDRSQNENGATDYSNVGYLIYVKTPNVIRWANPSGKSFQNNLVIEVDATKPADGPDDNAFGLICRYVDTNNFYYFFMSSDGFAGIGRKKNGFTNIISSPDGLLTEITALSYGAATNHLRADCVGRTLTFYVNGTQVATATDGSFIGGNVGLIARTYDIGGVDIQFSNFTVFKPASAVTPSVTP